MIDFSAIRLGKRVAIQDDRTLKLAKYLTPAGLLPPPSIVDWSMGLTDFGYMGNDRLGDCTCAAVGHAVQTFTGNNGKMVTIPDPAIISAYSAVSGYNPNTGAHDDGANVIDVLNYSVKTGVGGHKFNAYASIEAGSGGLDLPTLQQSTFLFGVTYIGVQLPLSAKGQNIWDVMGPLSRPNNQPGSWGGHAIIVVSGIDDNGTRQFEVVSWGGLIPVTAAFLEAYCDEAFALLSSEWMDSGNAAPNCIDMAMLTADLQAVTS